MTISNFRTQNGPFVLNKFFFLVQTIIITFIYLLALFTVQNLKKILTTDPFCGSKMVHLSQTNGPLFLFFFWKNLIKSFSSTCWPLSLCKILQKFLEWIQSYEDASFLHPKQPKIKKNSTSQSRVMTISNFWTQNGPFVLNKFFFSTNHYYYFHLSIGPFHCAKFKKNSYNRSILWVKNGPFVPNKWTTFFVFFLEKLNKIIFVYLLAPFTV